MYNTDDNWQVFESDETNNTNYHQIEIRGPELNIKNISLSKTSVAPAKFVTIEAKILNSGYMPTPALTEISYYLSVNSSLDDSDILLDKTDIPVIDTGDSIEVQTDIIIPVETTVGTYQIIAVVDEANVIHEEDELNNSFFEDIEIISSDLSFFAPPTLLNQVIPQSGFIENEIQIINNGPGDNDITSAVSMYLSVDDEIDANDVLIDTEHIGPLLAGEISTITSAFNVPDTCQMGEWSVIYVLDETNAINEMDEDNNTTLSGFTISASDLTSKSSVINTHVQAGAVFTVNTEIANIGNFNSKSVVGLSYYLSEDTLFDNLDTYLLANEIETLSGGDNSNVNQSLYIENKREIGSRYLLSVIDNNDAEDEIDESNNLSFTQFDLVATDFMFTDFFADNNLVAGQPASAKQTVANTGAGDAYTVSSIDWYLSKDTIADNSDLCLANNTLQTLQSNERFTFTQNIDVPLFIALSDWFLITSGIYNFSLIESLNMENIDVYIDDLVLDSITNISDIQYSVMLNAGTYDNRFRLLFSGNRTSINQGVKLVDPTSAYERTLSHVFSFDNNIYIHMNMQSIGIYVEVYSILGQKLIHQQIVSDYTKIPIHNGKGIYLVKLYTNEGIIKTAKVYVDK